MSAEPTEFSILKKWIIENGGSFHPNVQFKYAGTTGNTAIAIEGIPADASIVSCPFSLVITEERAQKNLSSLFSTEDVIGWTERQWISTYICLHWILSDSKPPELAHYPYINTLPISDQLRTSLWFTEPELEAFKGSNLYAATIDRKHEWKEEWQQCQSILSSQNDVWGRGLTWWAFMSLTRYLTAATYISSRAFPSSLLSPNPTLKTTEATKPVLLPGVDSLNHKRGQPVSWSIAYPIESGPTSSTSITKEPTVSLVLHIETLVGGELFNNYGPKPNAELILGYGFALPNNPDDTILLKIAGFEGRWEIGRSASGAEALWIELVQYVKRHRGNDDEEGEAYEIQMDATDILSHMVQTLLEKLPPGTILDDQTLRPEVANMLQEYTQGQRAILTSLLHFCEKKEEAAVDLARSLGIELVIED
ncbi:SET domain protein [Macrolepiota fuliginosa MF-IS2]|uniref:SET domain protein n=1 Tax=Macrolepiota fuliginosa MF-IS2 TaxID=1400762 RepID=A0A9P5XFU3_9AGAR|nr:SET domain protein [Macrolepiota fuliginosa MF-IS2]